MAIFDGGTWIGDCMGIGTARTATTISSFPPPSPLPTCTVHITFNQEKNEIRYSFVFHGEEYIAETLDQLKAMAKLLIAAEKDNR